MGEDGRDNREGGNQDRGDPQTQPTLPHCCAEALDCRVNLRSLFVASRQRQYLPRSPAKEAANFAEPAALK